MFFVNAALNDISIGTAGLVALLGYAVVFVGLIALMAVIMIVGKIMVAKKVRACSRSRCCSCCSGFRSQGCSRTRHRRRRRMQTL